MRIRGQELDINFAEEIEHIHFNNARIRDNKLQSCSPFRDDVKPSFAINLENGLWIDSGADVDHMKKGNIISFLAFANNQTFEEVEDYLLDKYSIDYSDVSKLELKINLGSGQKETIKYLDENFDYKYSKYLDEVRGINKDIQEMFKTFECIKDGKNVVGMAWRDKTGKLLNIKYRCIDNKFFFYEEHGEPIKKHLFGLDKVLKVKPSEVWIVESEIDALYLWSCGLYAVALGRASFNEEQLKLIKKIGADNIVVATDNDPVGIAVKKALIKELLPHFNVSEFMFEDGIKDVNDIDAHIIKNKKYILKKNKISFKI